MGFVLFANLVQRQQTIHEHVGKHLVRYTNILYRVIETAFNVQN